MDYQEYFEQAVAAGSQLALLDKKLVSKVLKDLSAAVLTDAGAIITANRADLAKKDPAHPVYDRLLLNRDRLQSIAAGISAIADMDTPLGQLISGKTLPNGLELSRVRVPLGVIGIIYEARPNVTLDVFALCFKTGNVAVLKGGSDAAHSNLALTAIIQRVLAANHIDEHAVVLLPSEREATAALLNATGYVDVLIPRGSQSLINYVRAQSRIPVIETGAGIVHIYFDRSGDTGKGKAIINNAKTRRVSVCNALDCLLIHADRLNDLFSLTTALSASGVKIYADQPAYAALQGNYPQELLYMAAPADYGTEFLDYKLAVKTVASLQEALAHIARHSSRHSEAIIAEDGDTAELFLHRVDAAAVYANASTAFTDGGEFGLGAEIGISTQKLHARGPMGLDELTSYKWIIRGSGQIR